jgi:ABC-type uncharacterized transport system auxiliary subunit
VTIASRSLSHSDRAPFGPSPVSSASKPSNIDAHISNAPTRHVAVVEEAEAMVSIVSTGSIQYLEGGQWPSRKRVDDGW